MDSMHETIVSVSRVNGGEAEPMGTDAHRLWRGGESLWQLSSGSFCSLSEIGSKVIV